MKKKNKRITLRQFSDGIQLALRPLEEDMRQMRKEMRRCVRREELEALAKLIEERLDKLKTKGLKRL
jgi:hypothetical protein